MHSVVCTVQRTVRGGSDRYPLALRSSLTGEAHAFLKLKALQPKMKQFHRPENEMFLALMFLLSRGLNKREVSDLQYCPRLLNPALNRRATDEAS